MTDKKLTDEEIIKRLEQCVKRGNRNYNTDIVLDLINRQKAENEMLKKRISEQKHALFEQQEHTAELQQKLETKCDDCDNIRLSRPEYWKAIKTAKAEAYKEFASRLKDAFPECNRDCKCPAIYFDDYCYIIDECCEEMVGEEK